MDTNEELEKAITARDEFLEMYPEAREYQAIINRELDGIENPETRMCIILKKLLETNVLLVETLKETIKKER